MKVSIYGLGYVGLVSSACLSNEGHQVIGVDINLNRINMINEGLSPIIEPSVNDYIHTGVKNGNIKATIDSDYAILNSDISIICVGTPSKKDGNLDLEHVYKVVKQIALALRQKKSFHLIVIRSTVSPGTIIKAIKIVKKISEKVYSKEFDIAINPEFLREGSAIKDYYNPPYILVGTKNFTSLEMLRTIYSQINAPFLNTDPEIAEIIKFVSNSFHALKVTFANEIGRLAKQLKIDGKELMDIFIQDDKLNISTYYLMPGKAFGGSCLPKDTKALSSLGTHLGVKLPLISNIIDSNEEHMKDTIELINQVGIHRIGFLGIAFKENTDDLRESPLITIIEALIGKGFDIKIYDEYVNTARLIEVNKAYIETLIPYISRLMVDTPDKLIEHADLLVVANNNPSIMHILNSLDDDKTVFDLVGINTSNLKCKYYGVCW